MLDSLRNSLKQAESVDILTAFFYFSGFDALADDLFKNIENDFCVTGINNYNCFNPELYRIRPQIDKPQSEITTNDLFHIPYSKRYLLKNERFSISGRIS